MKWNNNAINILFGMYNEGKPDVEIARFLGSTTYSVARKRSELGFTKFRVKKHTRKARTIRPTKQLTPFILHYNDGVSHYMAGSLDVLTTIAQTRLQANVIKEAYIYKAHKKIVPLHKTISNV